MMYHYCLSRSRILFLLPYNILHISNTLYYTYHIIVFKRSFSIYLRIGHCELIFYITAIVRGRGLIKITNTHEIHFRNLFWSVVGHIFCSRQRYPECEVGIRKSIFALLKSFYNCVVGTWRRYTMAFCLD